MGKIKLDNRLSAVARLVRKGSRVADVGTDHGYLIGYLIENGICPCGFATDLRVGPLDNARKTAKEYGISDKIRFILSNGLEGLPDGEYDDVVIAGMGGILICEILKKNMYIRNEKINVVVQPMSHAEKVREFFSANGFSIDEENTSTDGKRLYLAISAHYTGEIQKFEPSYYYIGKLFESVGKDCTNEYLQRQYSRLKKRYDALKINSINSVETENLRKILNDFPKDIW